MEEVKYAKLEILNKKKELLSYVTLNPGENILGRILGETELCKELVDDVFLSRQHFIIKVEEDTKGILRYYLRDNGSSNGTWVKYKKNDKVKKLNERDFLELSDGDVISGGETFFVLRKGDSSERKEKNSSHTTLVG